MFIHAVENLAQIKITHGCESGIKSPYINNVLLCFLRPYRIIAGPVCFISGIFGKLRIQRLPIRLCEKGFMGIKGFYLQEPVVRICIFLKKGVPSSIMRKFIYKSGRTQSAQGRETCP